MFQIEFASDANVREEESPRTVAKHKKHDEEGGKLSSSKSAEKKKKPKKNVGLSKFL